MTGCSLPVAELKSATSVTAELQLAGKELSSPLRGVEKNTDIAKDKNMNCLDNSQTDKSVNIKQQKYCCSAADKNLFLNTFGSRFDCIYLS